MIEGILVEGLIFAIMALGILISYRILDMADLTCDGSVATGAAVATMCIVNGLGIAMGLVMSFLVGVLCGLVTATIHNKLKLPVLLAGILTMTMLYSINLRILGNKANVSLVRVDTLYRLFPQWFSFVPSDIAALIGTLVFVVAVTAAMDNGLIALSGGLLAQYQGFADANLGQGMVVQGLAAVMIGEFLFSSNRISLITLRCILGGIIYKGLMFLGRKYGYLIGITPNDFKLLTGILVIISLTIAKTRTLASDKAARRKSIERAMKKEGTNA